MKLKRIKFKNVGYVQDVELELGTDLTVLVGDNDSGKTALLDAIYSTIVTINNNKHPYLIIDTGREEVELDVVDQNGHVCSFEVNTVDFPRTHDLSLNLPAFWRVGYAEQIKYWALGKCNDSALWDNELENTISLVDNFGEGLYPPRQATLLPRLREARPATQLIIATHSPVILDTALSLDNSIAYRVTRINDMTTAEKITSAPQ